MNILLIEQECFNPCENKPLHVGAHSLHIAEYITNSLLNNTMPKNFGKVFVLAQKGSLYEKVAQSKGLNIISMPEGGFITFKFYFLLKKHKINLVHTFDIESAKFLHSMRLLSRKINHAHSENRYLEEKDVFFSPVFKKTQGYLFADEVYKDHYGVCFGYNNSTVIPITLAPSVLPENQVQTISNTDENPSLFLYTEQDNKDKEAKKVRFLIPCPLTTDGKYPDIMEVLKAFNTIKGKEYDWEALFLGLGNQMQDMIQLAQEAGILDHLLIFTGIENKDFFESGDVCIFPVSTDEHIITPLLAAWQNKIPTIINEPIPYCPLAKDERAVIIEDMKNPSAFALALDKLLTDKELRDKLEKFGTDALSDICGQEIDYFSFYKKTIENKIS